MKHIPLKKLILPFLGLLTLTGALITTYFASQQRQEVRQQATSPTGTASVVLSPSSTTVPAGTTQQSNLSVNLANQSVDGFQVVADIVSTAPADIQFSPATPSGLLNIVSSVKPSDAGKKFRLAFLTKEPTVPFTASGLVTLGTFSITSPNESTVSIVFDQTLSKILQHQTVQDVLAVPTDTTYTFVVPTPTPTPAPTATPTLTPTPSPSPTPTPNITPSVTPAFTPTPRPTVTPTPTPSPRPTPTPTPIPKTSITIRKPNGGETLTVGQRYLIRWTSNRSIDRVSIGLTTGTGPMTWIATNIRNLNYYVWKVNVGTTTATKFKLYIIGYQKGTSVASDFSNNYFTVLASTR